MSPRPRGLDDLDRIDAVFAALSHPTRRQSLTVLRARGGTRTSGELADRFDCTWPTTSRHLRLLADAGLVTVTKRGRERDYTLNAAALADNAGHRIDRVRP